MTEINVPTFDFDEMNSPAFLKNLFSLNTQCVKVNTTHTKDGLRCFVNSWNLKLCSVPTCKTVMFPRKYGYSKCSNCYKYTKTSTNSTNSTITTINSTNNPMLVNFEDLDAQYSQQNQIAQLNFNQRNLQREQDTLRELQDVDFARKKYGLVPRKKNYWSNVWNAMFGQEPDSYQFDQQSLHNFQESQQLLFQQQPQQQFAQQLPQQPAQQTQQIELQQPQLLLRQLIEPQQNQSIIHNVLEIQKDVELMNKMEGILQLDSRQPQTFPTTELVHKRFEITELVKNESLEHDPHAPCHLLFLGKTNAGKSWTLAHLATELNEIRPINYIFLVCPTATWKHDIDTSGPYTKLLHSDNVFLSENFTKDKKGKYSNIISMLKTRFSQTYKNKKRCILIVDDMSQVILDGELPIEDFFFNGRKQHVDVFLIFHGNIKQGIKLKQLRGNATAVLTCTKSIIYNVVHTDEFVTPDSAERKRVVADFQTVMSRKYTFPVITPEHTPTYSAYLAPGTLDAVKTIGEIYYSDDEEDDDMDVDDNGDDNDDDDGDEEEFPDLPEPPKHFPFVICQMEKRLENLKRSLDGDDDDELVRPNKRFRNQSLRMYLKLYPLVFRCSWAEEKEYFRLIVSHRDLHLLFTLYFRYTQKGRLLHINTRKRLPLSYYNLEENPKNKKETKKETRKVKNQTTQKHRQQAQNPNPKLEHRLRRLRLQQQHHLHHQQQFVQKHPWR